jgi:hypothetical protein
MVCAPGIELVTHGLQLLCRSEQMAAVNPRAIAGKWQSGVALDIHTISSTYLGVNEHGHDVYDTKTI